MIRRRTGSRPDRRTMLVATVLPILLSFAPGTQAQEVLAALGYETTVNVNNELLLGLDIAAMRAAHDSFATKKNIYENGSPENTGTLTLQSLSLSSEAQWGAYPLYNIYRAGFDLLGQQVEGDDPGNFDGRPIANYADTLVNDLFLLNVTNIESEAALVMNVYMAFYGSLYDMLTECAKGSSANAQVMHRGLDKAAAYWVGQGQVRGDSNTGYLFYNMAQFVGERFNQFGQDDSEVTVNTEVIAELLLLKADINNGVCQSDSNNRQGYGSMRIKVKSLMSAANQVLLQMLIHRIKTVKPNEPTNFVELYALAVLPQIAACDTDIFMQILELTVKENVDASTQEALIEALQQVYSCLGVTCQRMGSYQVNVVPQCDESAILPMAGYAPTFDVREKARLDRDIRQIRWFLQFGQTDAAWEWYTEGNLAFESPFTLQQLARGQTTFVTSLLYQQAGSYWGTGATDTSFVNGMIEQVIQKTGFAAGATVEQIQGYMDSLLRGVVFLLAITNELESAIALGSAAVPDLESAQKAWDSAAALFLGSTEGPEEFGALEAPGESLYGLSNDLCFDFNICDEETDMGVSGQAVLDALEKGRDELKTGDASNLQESYNLVILPNLVIPVLQGFLENAIEAGLDNNRAEIAFEYGYSRTILPYFNEFGSVTAIQQAVNPNPSPSNTDTIFGAISNLLSQPTVATDCASVGAVRGSDDVARGVCLGVTPDAPPRFPETRAPNLAPAPTPPPVPVTRGPVAAKPTANVQLGWGRFAFNNPSQAAVDAKVALDVKAMWTATDVSTSKQVYDSGQNFLSGLYQLPTVTSLSAMSTKSNEIMPEDAIFNFYRAALYQDSLFDDSASANSGLIWRFADQVVNMALDPQQGNSPILAAEATVVLNSFHVILRQLYEANRQCLQNQGQNALRYLDSAVAIWLGEGQAEGEYNSGYMMYSQAQLARNHFRLPEQEAASNAAIMSAMNEARSLFQSCSTNNLGTNTSYLRMRLVIKRIAKYLTVPLVQELLYYISAGDSKFEELMSVAFLPQLAACNGALYTDLRQNFFQGRYFSASSQAQKWAVSELAAGLHDCLGFTCEDLGDASNADHPLLTELVQDLCDEFAGLDNSTYLAGFELGTPREQLEADLDLDVHQIDMLMRTGALATAQEWYELGYNSLEPPPPNNANAAFAPQTTRSLQNLAAEVTIDNPESTNDLGGLYVNFFGQGNHPNAFIQQVFGGAANSPYQAASRAQQAQAVHRTLQVMVPYLAVEQRLEQALAECRAAAADQGGGMGMVDRAAGLFVGSIEGHQSGGGIVSGANSGTLLMALGKEVCAAFGECESNGDSSANEFILFAMADMKTWLNTGDCDSANSIKDESLLPMLQVGILQAILSFAQLSEPLPVGSDDDKLASLDICTKTLLPQIQAVNQTIALQLESNTDFDPTRRAVSDTTPVLVQAVARVLRPLGVDCDVIGSLQPAGLSTCNTGTPDVAPPPDTTTTLGDDDDGDDSNAIYQSTTYVQDRADIAKDVAQMEDDLKLNHRDQAEFIYKIGQNSPVYDKFGIKVDVRALADFSTNATNTMQDNPLWHVAVFALQDENGLYLGQPAGQFADTIVQESFGKGGTLAAEAAVILNLWMEVANELYESLANCKREQIHDDDGIHSMDEVAAYWIGDGEVAGNAQQGHLLYNLAELMALKFGTMHASGLATVNLKFLRQLNEAKLMLSFPEACAGGATSTTARKLQRVITRIVSQMMVVQIQALMDAVLTNDRDRVRVYAHGFVPLLKACNEPTFLLLQDQLLEAAYEETQVDDVIASLYSVLPCYEITCADIGTHQEAETGAVCQDPAFQAPLAGYHPSSDVLEFAALDLDILLLDILMQQKAYSVAKDVYMYGKHSMANGNDGAASLSLQNLAKSTRRPSVPEYNTFVQYYNGNNNYADTLILQALDSDIPFNQRHATVVGGAQFLVLYMAVLEEMHEAVRECEAGPERRVAAQLLWNKAAAYIIGSMELGAQNEPYSKRQGVFLWGVAKEHCTEFGTCPNIITGMAAVNERVRSLLYSGRGAVGSGACPALAKVTRELSPQLLVPMIQRALSSVLALEAAAPGSPELERHHARAYTAARAILPLIDQKDRDTATTIAAQLDYDGPPLEGGGGSEAVTVGILNSLGALGVDCALVGSAGTIVNSCTAEVSFIKSKRAPLVIGLALGVVFGAALAVLLFLYHQKKRSQTPEQPKFVRNTKGVLDEADKEFQIGEQPLPPQPPLGPPPPPPHPQQQHSTRSFGGPPGNNQSMRSMGGPPGNQSTRSFPPNTSTRDFGPERAASQRSAMADADLLHNKNDAAPAFRDVDLPEAV